MKYLTLILVCLASFQVKAQNDTLLKAMFDSVATDGAQNIAVEVTNQLDLNGWGNVTWLASDLKADLIDPTSQWYEEDLWQTWHKIPYIESIDTTVTIDTTTYDTTVNVGMRSFSWFASPNQALSVLLTPPVYLSDNTGKLTWKSMPIQGPRYQDGYKVMVLTGANNTVFNTDPTLQTPQFIMKEMDNSSGSPSILDSSLAAIEKDYGFVPANGVMHTEYTLPAATGSGLVDSSRQQPFMQEFEIDLSSYSGFIQVMFFHDSDDDNGIILDDIVITGTGALSSKEVDAIEVDIYPNPASHNISVNMIQGDRLEQLEVLSSDGRLVQITSSVNQIQNRVVLNVSELAEGMYFVRIQGANKVYQGSFIKR